MPDRVQEAPQGFSNIRLDPRISKFFLFLPYRLLLRISGEVRIEVGRYSALHLANVMPLAPPAGRDKIDLSIGTFCEFAADATIVFGGEHHNERIFKCTFGQMAQIFRKEMNPEEIALADPVPAKGIRLGANVTLSQGATVLDGTEIGTGAVIGAGALVKGTCQEFGIYAGTPARLMKSRFPLKKDQELYKATRWTEVHAHDVPRLPSLLARLQNGEISLDDFQNQVSYIEKMPTVVIDVSINAGKLVPKNILGYAVGSQSVDDPSTREKLNEYFKQANNPASLKWTPDIFHTLGLY